MLRPDNLWPKTPAASGTLFFAQAMKSFLDADEFEGFRAYTLDTLGRLSEAIHIAENVSAGLLSQPVFETTAKELAWSLRSDLAARSIATDECSLIIERCEKDAQNYRALLGEMKLLKRRLYPYYRDTLAEQVVSRVNDPKKRGELLATTGFLVSHLINDGHDREFLTHRLEKRFFTVEIKRVGASVVKAFIQSIGNERKEYNVIHGIDNAAEKLVAGRNGWTVTTRDELPDMALENVLSWQNHERYNKFATKTEISQDPYRAAISANDELERLKAFMIIPTKQVRVHWSKECFVHRPRGVTGESLIRFDRPLQKFSAITDGARFRIEQTVSLLRKMDKSFDGPSLARLSRAVATANAATKTTEDATRLIAIWSAFEVLSSDPDETRIIHFLKELVPCICIKYHRRVFAATYSQLSMDYKGPFRRLIRDTIGPGEGGSYVRFAKFILLPEYDAERTTLLSMVSENPLALHRLFRLEKYYGDPKQFYRTMASHAERVSWQLKRIYRVRNSLVHAGEAPNFIESLLGNGLDYFRSCVTNLIRVAARDECPSDIDSVITEVSMDWELTKRKLLVSGNGGFDKPTIDSLFRPL